MRRPPDADQALRDTFGTLSCFKSPSLYSRDADFVYATSPSAKDASSMGTSPLYSAPTESAHLDTLAIVSVGLSLDVYRQGQAWAQMQQQDAREPNSLHVGNILPTDPKKYPVTVDTKNMAWDQRMQDALELGLKDFPEAWPIPTITIVRGWNRNATNLRFPQIDEIQSGLTRMVNNLRPEAGLHWHEIDQLPNGVICSDTPDDVVEDIFRTFEDHPDMPAMLVYVLDGYNAAYKFSTKDQTLIGVGNGPRERGELTDAMVALVVARPERLDWLRGYARYTKPNPNPISPRFAGWARMPPSPMNFQPSPFIPLPWNKRAFEQWDAMKTLAVLHRPVTVSLDNPDKPGRRLKNEALTTALADGWKKAIGGVTPPPARVFYDGGQKPAVPPLGDLIPALKLAGSPLDLFESNESYDLTQRLGDTGAASPFVGIAVATMATYLNADTSVVVPLRRADQATLITLTSATPGKKPTNDPFGVNLLPQTATSEVPSARIQAEQFAAWQANQTREQNYSRPFDPEQAERDRKTLDEFIASGPRVDLDKL
ncbi:MULTISPECIES: type VI lipase adapter Tla3 domain-containing protein [unclassified Dyella]|uniref:type VI lipase adapter Tla3 domain-containing protein n=1 Tax=unclassified Dyella TaxID=2634549 RepID=UPI003F8FE6D6